MADLGCGTGILPIITSELGGYTGSVYSFDMNTNSIEATKMNSQIFGLSDRVHPVEIDLVDMYYPSSNSFSDN